MPTLQDYLASLAASPVRTAPTSAPLQPTGTFQDILQQQQQLAPAPTAPVRQAPAPAPVQTVPTTFTPPTFQPPPPTNTSTITAPQPAPRQIPAPAPVQTTAPTLPIGGFPQPSYTPQPPFTPRPGAPTRSTDPGPLDPNIVRGGPARPSPGFTPPDRGLPPTGTQVAPNIFGQPLPRQIPAPAPVQTTAPRPDIFRFPPGTAPPPRTPLPLPGQQVAPNIFGQPLPQPAPVQQPGFVNPFPDRGTVGPTGLPGQAAQPAQINIGNIIRRLMAITPRIYRNLLPSDKARISSAVSQLGVPPEDFWQSVFAQWPPGVNPAGISFGTNF